MDVGAVAVEARERDDAVFGAARQASDPWCRWSRRDGVRGAGHAGSGRRGYDRQPEREWRHLSWGRIPALLRYAPWRVSCRRCRGVKAAYLGAGDGRDGGEPAAGGYRG